MSNTAEDSKFALEYLGGLPTEDRNGVSVVVTNGKGLYVKGTTKFTSVGPELAAFYVTLEKDGGKVGVFTTEDFFVKIVNPKPALPTKLGAIIKFPTYRPFVLTRYGWVNVGSNELWEDNRIQDQLTNTNGKFEVLFEGTDY